MGLIGKILSFVRVVRNGANISDVKLNPGGGPNRTAEHFADAGDDSHPLTTDYVYAAPTPQRGRVAAVGYVDPLNTPQAQPGEKRIYARDSGTGAVVVELHLKNDGTATLFNSEVEVTIDPAGNVLIDNTDGEIRLDADGTFEAENGNGAVTLNADGSIMGQNSAGSFELQVGGNFVVNGVVITPAGLITTPTGIVTPSAVINGVEADGHTHAQGNDSAGNTEQNTGPMI